jgi:hypothetical protein
MLLQMLADYLIFRLVAILLATQGVLLFYPWIAITCILALIHR